MSSPKKLSHSFLEKKSPAEGMPSKDTDVKNNWDFVIILNSSNVESNNYILFKIYCFSYPKVKQLVIQTNILRMNILHTHSGYCFNEINRKELANYVITVGCWRPVYSESFDNCRAISTRGFKTSCASLVYVEESDS